MAQSLAQAPWCAVQHQVCKKNEQNKKFQCQASEALGLLPVLVHLVKTFLLPNDLVCPQICKAFLACADIVDLVHLGQTWGVCTPGALQQAAEMCLASWVGSQPSRPYDKEIPLDFAFGACIGKIQKITCLFCNGTQTSLYLQICIKYLQYCCVWTHTASRMLGRRTISLEATWCLCKWHLFNRCTPTKETISFIDGAKLWPCDSHRQLAGCFQVPIAKILVHKARHCAGHTFSSNGSFGLCFLQGKCVCFCAAAGTGRRCQEYWSMLLDSIRKTLFGACWNHFVPIDLQQGPGQDQCPWQVRHFLKQWTLHSYLKKCAAAFLFASLISFWLQASLAADGKLHWLLTAKLHWLLLASLIGF